MGDPRRLFDSKDAEAAALYANLITGGAEDFYPLKVDANGYLLISMTVGSVSLSSTASTITNAVGNPVNVSLTSTIVTIESAGLNVTPTTTASTITNAVGNPVNVALTNTEVTVKSAIAGFNVNVATATLGTVTVTGTVTPSTTASTITNAVGNPVNVSLTSTAVSISTSVTYSTLILNSKTLTGSSGSISATWTSIFTPATKAKIYAFSFTTTSTSEVTVIICDGAFADAKEKWRITLLAPSGASAGANLAIPPPAFLFGSRSTSAVTISLSTAVLVHYSLSLFDEA